MPTGITNAGGWIRANYEVVGRTTDKLTLISDERQILQVDTAFESSLSSHQIEIAVEAIACNGRKTIGKWDDATGEEFTNNHRPRNIVRIKYADERTGHIRFGWAQKLGLCALVEVQHIVVRENCGSGVNFGRFHYWTGKVLACCYQPCKA
ncbi:hypothetical protein FD724_37165 (plasmid) [Nostoc sp. C057]|uniref:hypothetical protein n=1 Tax=Nostoc sp. C057 TaxID=2576903 RepID=UPI0015C3F77A|nr:hypothetical protein [Nostoc sp. C057]QLE53518.1 hypothetical protein FD724_37165 [Nostoc sp. C057]